MRWNRRQARSTLLLFLLLFSAGRGKALLTAPIYPEPHGEGWPPPGHVVDATALPGKALEVFPGGTTVGTAVSLLGTVPDLLGSGFCLPRAGVLSSGPEGWTIRPMTQRERWVWRLPMNLYECEREDLERIKGIGPSLAGEIVRFVGSRGYLNSVEELQEIPGLGPGRMKMLRKDLEIP